MKSLKWPAWSEASCRLSVKLRSLRASSLTAVSLRNCTIADPLTSVVAVLRPVWLRRVSLRKSFFSVRSNATPQRRQSRNGLGWNQTWLAASLLSSTFPSAATKSRKIAAHRGVPSAQPAVPRTPRFSNPDSPQATGGGSLGYNRGLLCPCCQRACDVSQTDCSRHREP